MASSAKHFSLFLLLLTLLLHNTHARDSQLFNKIPSTTSKNVVVPNTKETPANNQQEQQQDPNFLPENENSYGLYGHESGQLAPSATTTFESKQPLHKYLPKNYNPVAYVTKPDDINDSTATFTAEEKTYATNPDSNNYYSGGAQNYYNNNNSNQQEEEETEYPTTNNRDNNNNNYYYYNRGSSFNSQPQGMSDTRFSGGAALSSRGRYYSGNGGGANNGFQPQGMSDTRFLENGKYYYDLNTEKYSSNHPYESLRAVRGRNEFGNVNNNRNYYGNGENVNGYEFNGENAAMGGYQNPEEFQDEENMP